MSKVFISYARDGSYGENLAVEIQQQLLAAGFAVFRDVIGLKPGDVWFHKLDFELESSQVMVLVLSEKVRTSTWVSSEVDLAKELGIPIVPVLAEKMIRPTWIRHLQALDFCVSKDWMILLDALEHHVGSGAVEVREKPVWASVAGDDQYGRYADLVVKDITQKFRWIEPGTFWMGSPESEPNRSDDEIQHQVTLTKGFWLADTACTQFLWTAVLDNNPAFFTDDANNPVEQVSWHDTQTFLQKLNASVSGLNARLPTEAEWEYACRAGTNTPFSFGDNISPEQVNYDDSQPHANVNRGLCRQKTVSVKSLSANAWGLYEMHGNVWEWCQDRYGYYLEEPVTNPEGSQSGVGRVIRGGSWRGGCRNVRAAFRDHHFPAIRDNLLGFRLALGL